jgi:hypothetical protein
LLTLTLSPGTGHDPAPRTPRPGGSLIRQAQQQDSSASGGTYRLPEDGPLPDLALYERLIADGIAAADARGSIVDHVTARRLAIWLAARPQAQPFAQGLVRFINTGAINEAFKTELRKRVRSGTYSREPQAARLLQYCASRGDQLGPIDKDFGRTCDQIDRADVMLAGLRERARQGLGPPGQVWPEIDGPRTTAMARRDPESQAVTLVLDAASASIAMFAITAHADEREAHIREVERFGQTLPEDSYGRRNREAIAAREKRVAARLRAVEYAFRTAIERDAEPSLPQSTWTSRAERDADVELDLE